MKVTATKTQERKLKVGYQAHPKKKWTGKTDFAPKILLAGNWLQYAGFTIGDSVQVNVCDNRITIDKITEVKNV